ncbi:MAG: DUF58 domain-containing protein [Prevotella sp.]|nr:DUF58 domain-containing protein [Prevotella sp.]
MFLTRRLYIALSLVILCIAAGWWWMPLFHVGRLLLLVLLVAVVADAVALWQQRAVSAGRVCSERFSNGDQNAVTLWVESSYPFLVRLEIIDEAPFVFQRRDISFGMSLRPQAGRQTLTYHLRPTKRGVYAFGLIRVFASTPIGLLQRRYTCGQPQDVKVYPSYLMLHHYEFLAIHQNLREAGIKRIRRVGHQTEFEQIKDYVVGDDYRTINWRATARRHQLMVNVYQDERSQQIYHLIDKGRVMQQAFQGLTLLDYAINASLALSYVAVRKDDKAGLITFADTVDTLLPASRHSGHLQRMQEALYAQKTDFGETDFSALCVAVNQHVQRTSLLIVYTNFIGMVALRRQLPFLQQLGRRHRLLLVFFEDAELQAFAATPPADAEERCQHQMAQRYIHEKQLMATTLRHSGIYALLTAPERLTADVINRYLEMKSQGLLA